MKDTFIQNALFLVSKSIELQIGGEFAFGGIFNADEEEQHDIFKNWNDFLLPIVQQVMALPEHHQQPILQAAII